jgi:AcrR family transcriptional regulator
MTLQTDSTSAKQRADAVANRQVILEAGARQIAEQGIATTLNDVARAAGVGVATVYRNFENRDALLDGLFALTLDRLVVLAEEAAAIGDDPRAFETYLFAVMHLHASDRGVVPVLMRSNQSAEFSEQLARQLGPRVQPLIQAAQSAGTLRDGFTIQDLCLLSAMVGSVANLMRDSEPDLWERYARLLIDGTRPHTNINT